MGLEGIKTYKHRHGDIYTWHVKSPKQVEVAYYVYPTYKEIVLSYSQEPIKMVHYIKKAVESQNFYSITFIRKSPKTPMNMDIRGDGSIELNWSEWLSAKYIPHTVKIKPDGTIDIIWQDTIYSDIEDDPKNSVKSKHDKQNNLLYLVKGLPSGFTYKLELVSPNTYKVSPYHIKNVNRWVSLIAGSKAIKVIHI